MPKKEDLIQKLCRKPSPKNFTTHELDVLMRKCDCNKYSGGRGSSIAYYHTLSGRILTFDGPHPGNELYNYQVQKVIKFLGEIGVIEQH